MEDGEKDGVVDLLDEHGDDGDEEDVLVLVPISENEEDERALNLLVVNDNRGLMLDPCGGFGQGVLKTYRCPGCDAHMHLFCGDAIEKEGYG